MIERASKFRRAPNVASRTVEDQAVVIVMGGETLHSFNATGTWIWDTCCEGTFDLESLASRLAQHYRLEPQQARADVEAFLTSLAAVGAIEEVDHG